MIHNSLLSPHCTLDPQKLIVNCGSLPQQLYAWESWHPVKKKFEILHYYTASESESEDNEQQVMSYVIGFNLNFISILNITDFKIVLHVVL